LFRRFDRESDGRLTKDDLLSFFDEAAKGKAHLSTDDLRDALSEALRGGSKPTDAPSTETLLRGFFAGDLGSMNEGPKLDAVAPDFRLKTVDGGSTVHLAEVAASKPVLLVFGSFT
jgi:hypothetical protein